MCTVSDLSTISCEEFLFYLHVCQRSHFSKLGQAARTGGGEWSERSLHGHEAGDGHAHVDVLALLAMAGSPVEALDESGYAQEHQTGAQRCAGTGSPTNAERVDAELGVLEHRISFPAFGSELLRVVGPDAGARAQLGVADHHIREGGDVVASYFARHHVHARHSERSCWVHPKHLLHDAPEVWKVGNVGVLHCALMTHYVVDLAL